MVSVMPKTPTTKLEDLIPASEVATTLQVSRTAVTKMVEDGRLVIILKLSNGQLLFDRTMVNRLAQERAAGAVA